VKWLSGGAEEKRPSEAKAFTPPNNYVRPKGLRENQDRRV
jgi:hypothetical protein